MAYNEVTVIWDDLDEVSRDQFHALYLYKDTRTKQILWIGLAYRQTISERWTCGSKAKFKEWARKQGYQNVHALVGTIDCSQNVTEQLAKDIERLLIHSVQPLGNVQHKESCNLSRSDLSVLCIGQWPHRIKEFSYLEVLV